MRRVVLLTVLMACAREPAADAEWRITGGTPAPWTASATVDTAQFRGAAVSFAADRVAAPHPLGCAQAEYEYVVTPAEGLFQGALLDDDVATRVLGFDHLPALTLRVTCDAGIFDYHFTRSDALVTALDNVVWRLSRTAPAASPADVVRALLAEHMTRDMGFTAEAMHHRAPFLTSELNALVAAYFAQPFPDDEPPPINGDPITNTQEYPTRFALRAGDTAADRATVHVTFSDDYVTRAAEFILVRTPAGWRVDDIVHEDGASLRELLALR